MADELTDFRLDNLTEHLEKLTDRISGYIESNEKRLTKVETTQKNFMWLFGAIMVIVNLAIKFL